MHLDWLLGDDQPMGLAIEQAVSPVRRDLERWGLPTPSVVEAAGEDPANWVPGIDAVVELDGNEMFPLAQADGDAERVAVVADHVQEWLIETVLWPNRATNWPPCPWHPETHPLVPRAVDAVAVWCCPVSGDQVARIGQLASPAS